MLGIATSRMRLCSQLISRQFSSKLVFSKEVQSPFPASTVRGVVMDYKSRENEGRDTFMLLGKILVGFYAVTGLACFFYGTTFVRFWLHRYSRSNHISTLLNYIYIASKELYLIWIDYWNRTHSMTPLHTVDMLNHSTTTAPLLM